MQVAEDGGRCCHGDRQHPNNDDANGDQALGFGPADERLDRTDDGRVAVDAQRRQREHGHADGRVFGEFGDLADEFAERPRLDRVDGARERHREDEHQQVAQRQVEDERIRHAAHRLVAA